MKKVASCFLLSLATIQTSFLFAQKTEGPKPFFSLTIEEDKQAARTNPGLHRLLVKYTNITQGDAWREFNEEAKGMYNMVVLRDGIPAEETTAMQGLRRYRKADNNPHLKPVKLFRPDESWIDQLDVSDYYDMTKPGTYQVTVTRESSPLNPRWSVLVTSNTITILVPKVISLHPAQVSGKPKPRFELFIWLVQPEIPFPVQVAVQMRNTSTSVIREAKCWSAMGMYNFVVKRDGEVLEADADQMRQLQETRDASHCPGNETLIEIEPGEWDGDDIPLSNFYDLEKPGSYSVYVTRETYPWNPAKSVLVESNIISFVVPEPSQTQATQPEEDTSLTQSPPQ
jgi:hypothetical protein